MLRARPHPTRSHRASHSRADCAGLARPRLLQRHEASPVIILSSITYPFTATRGETAHRQWNVHDQQNGARGGEGHTAALIARDLVGRAGQPRHIPATTPVVRERNHAHGMVRAAATHALELADHTQSKGTRSPRVTGTIPIAERAHTSNHTVLRANTPSCSGPQCFGVCARAPAAAHLKQMDPNAADARRHRTHEARVQ